VRLYPVIAAFVLALAGCRTTVPDKLPDPLPAPKGIDLGKVGTQLDVIDSRVAAAVIVAREANSAGKPAVVESELSVAGSFLPKPSEADIAFARQRSEKASPAEYEAQRKKAAEKQKEAEKAWTTLESQVEESKAALTARDKRITELTDEVARVKKDASANLWTMAGVGVAVIGAIAMAFTGPKVGIPLLLSGAAIGAFPFIVDSPYFNLIVGVSLGLAACLGLWVLWDAARDKVHQSDDEQAPPKI
jgi:hypothetical protein